MTSSHRSGRFGAAAVMLALGLLLILPSAAAAHAALDVATPADGSTVDGQPPEISGAFTQDIDPDGSSFELRDERGDVIAEGGVDPADPRRMVMEDVPELVPGEYEVRWITLSAEDGELDRDNWTFTVVAAPSPTPSPTPAPTATAAASATATAAASASPAASASGSASASPSPAPSPSDDGSGASGTSDVLLPIIVGLALVVLAGWFLLRRRSTGPTA